MTAGIIGAGRAGNVPGLEIRTVAGPFMIAAVKSRKEGRPVKILEVV